MLALLRGTGKAAVFGQNQEKGNHQRWAETNKKRVTNTEKSMVFKLGNLDFSLLSFI